MLAQKICNPQISLNLSTRSNDLPQCYIILSLNLHFFTALFNHSFPCLGETIRALLKSKCLFKHTHTHAHMHRHRHIPAPTSHPLLCRPGLLFGVFVFQNTLVKYDTITIAFISGLFNYTQRGFLAITGP